MKRQERESYREDGQVYRPMRRLAGLLPVVSVLYLQTLLLGVDAGSRV
jgi:hypothetical protein